jgi:aryl-alcohol dehydrogenase-like predicted oxidoreductase
MKFHRDDWRRRVFRGEVLEQILRRVDEFKTFVDPTVPLAQVALRFCLSHPAVTAVIPGVRSAEQARCNLGVLDQDVLPQGALSQIERYWHQEWHRQVRTSIGEEGEGERRAAGARQAIGSPSRR